MFTYDELRIIWWVIINILIIGFFVTDGFDMGVGVIMYLFGKSDIEKRVMINTIAPHWDGNQIWLISLVGCIFAVWPIVYSVLFSGFYIMIIIVLSSLFLRPLGFDYRSKIESIRWRKLWDLGIFIGSFIPMFTIGIVYGNLLQGVPFYIDKCFKINYIGDFLQLINPFSILCGITIVSMLLMHGSAYLQTRTQDNIQEKIYTITQIFSLLTIILFLVSIIIVIYILNGFNISNITNNVMQYNFLNKKVICQTGAWISNYYICPKLGIVPVISIVFLLFTFIFSKKRYDIFSFISSSISVISLILSIGITMFPFIIPSKTLPNSSLTIWNSTSSIKTLNIMFIIISIFLPIVISYTFWCYYKMYRRITEEYILQNKNSLY